MTILTLWPIEYNIFGIKWKYFTVHLSYMDELVMQRKNKVGDKYFCL